MKVLNHLSHYVPLLTILTVALLGYVLFQYDMRFKIGILIATSVSYVIWGLVHHLIHKDLHLIIILEYIAVAVLGSTVGYLLVI